MTLSRRSLLGSGAASLGAIAGAGAAPGLLSGATAASRRTFRDGAGRAPGPLIDDPAGRLALPAGFSYQLVAVSGETELRSGKKTPDRPDGTGAFAHGNTIRLVQNHEIGPAYGATNPVPKVRGTTYDDGLLIAGGCTVISVSQYGRRQGEWVGLSGTISNCAGGVTPWGTWLTCEEDESRTGTAFGPNGTAARDHGYVFEVAPAAADQQHPLPITAWGRYPHEAVVIAPSRKTVYLTEDASEPNGLFYRWTAPGGKALQAGSLQHLGRNAGRLEAMRVRVPRGPWIDDLSRFTSADIGRELEVRWVDVPDRQATTTSTRMQFGDGEVTRSKKLEGAWGDERGVYFASSYAHEDDVPSGGAPHDGQIWYLDHTRQVLVLMAYFPYLAFLHDGSLTLEQQKQLPTDYFDGPDNVHVTPFGGLVLAEDGDGVNGLIGWTRQNGAFRLARNDIDFEGGNSEMAGPTFSPDGRLLFASVQEPGHTFAIRGPFQEIFG